MKLLAIYITNNANAYSGVQPLRQAVLFIFIPDGNGMRYKKVAYGNTTEYYYNGTQLLAEYRKGTDELLAYFYDQSGVAGMRYQGRFGGYSYYYFDKNTLGDIIAIRDEGGNVVAEYFYDAWGNILHEEGGMASVNPFRYRGYYYDTETGFYYLQTRYYDPTICRFINADNYELVATLSSVPGQLNMYAYCGNNPIMYTDETGEIAWKIIIGAIIGVVFGAWTAAMEGENIVAGAIIGGIGGALTGAVSTIGSSIAVQWGVNALINLGVNTINDKINNKNIHWGNNIIEAGIQSSLGLISSKALGWVTNDIVALITDDFMGNIFSIALEQLAVNMSRRRINRFQPFNMFNGMNWSYYGY